MSADTFPRRLSAEDLKKPVKGAAKASRQRDGRKLKAEETRNKGIAKSRDLNRCRFPLCGCKKSGFRAEVSHDRHKGMGGNPAGDRSLPPGLITMCLPRHQTGVFSRHANTIRNRYLTNDGNNGPVAWDIWAPELARQMLGGIFAGYGDSVFREINTQVHRSMQVWEGWLEIDREYEVQKSLPRQRWQQAILERLAGMDL